MTTVNEPIFCERTSGTQHPPSSGDLTGNILLLEYLEGPPARCQPPASRTNISTDEEMGNFVV